MALIILREIAFSDEYQAVLVRGSNNNGSPQSNDVYKDRSRDPKVRGEQIMMNIALIVAVLMGLSIAFQPVTNAAAARLIGLAPLMVISNGLVLIGSLIYAGLVRERLNWGEITTLRPDFLFGGALYGLLILFGGIYVFPRLGATLALMVIILSQLVFGLVIDHYGLYGVPRQPMSWVRGLAIVFVVLGILLLRIKKV